MTSGAALLIALFIKGAVAPHGAVAVESAPAPRVAPITNVRLDLAGAGDCISRAELTSSVAARSRRIRFADEASVYARVSLTFARPGNVVAELVLASSGDEPPPRRFVARSCAEVADAIALIIAVTLDPTATVGASGPNGAPEPADKRAVPLQVPRPETPPAAPEFVAAPSPSIGAARRFGAMLAGQAIFGAAPGAMPGIALYGMAALDRAGPWAPALFLGATHAWRSGFAESGGTASFTLDAASLDACPLRVGRSPLVARPCASALVGRLGASGTDTQQGMSAARPFASAGVALNASFGSRIELNARVAVGMTLLRDAYEFGRTTFYRASAVTIGANLGVGLRWP